MWPPILLWFAANLKYKITYIFFVNSTYLTDSNIQLDKSLSLQVLLNSYYLYIK